MSDETRQDAEEGSPRRPESARQLLSTAGLLLAVLVILGLGAVLAVDPGSPPPVPVRTDIAPAPPAEPPPSSPIADLDEPKERIEEVAPPPSERHVEPSAPATPPGLATRAATDARRLARSGGTYTLQLLVGCKEETVERYLERSRSSSLYLLPATVKEQSCFRVTFGSYASQQEAAAAATGVPAELRSDVGAPSPKKIADLVL
jgi:septal ring-binding cell division protein DamX